MCENWQNCNVDCEKNREEPYCIGNYCEKHISCQKCHFKPICEELPHPKEPVWCNNLI